MFTDRKTFSASLKNEFVGGFSIEFFNDKQVELEVFRTDFLNAPVQIKNNDFNLELQKKYCNAGSFYLIYKLFGKH